MKQYPIEARQAMQNSLMRDGYRDCGSEPETADPSAAPQNSPARS